tara:strand:+ start:2536 stop:3138 length:603 start_codon:yes stop_codon:yes gene_type:complete
VTTTPLLIFEIIAIFLLGNLMNIKISFSDGARIQALVIGFLAGICVFFIFNIYAITPISLFLLLGLFPQFVFKADRENHGSRLMLGIGASFVVSYTFLFLAVYLAKSGSGEMALINACIPILFPYFSWLCGHLVSKIERKFNSRFFLAYCLVFVFILQSFFTYFVKENLHHFYICFFSWVFWLLKRKMTIEKQKRNLQQL